MHAARNDMNPKHHRIYTARTPSTSLAYTDCDQMFVCAGLLDRENIVSVRPRSYPRSAKKTPKTRKAAASDTLDRGDIVVFFKEANVIPVFLVTFSPLNVSAAKPAISWPLGAPPGKSLGPPASIPGPQTKVPAKPKEQEEALEELLSEGLAGGLKTKGKGGNRR